MELWVTPVPLHDPSKTAPRPYGGSLSMGGQQSSDFDVVWSWEAENSVLSCLHRAVHDSGSFSVINK